MHRFQALILLLLPLLPLAAAAQSCTTAVCTATGTSEAAVLAALPSSSNNNATVVVNIPAGTSAWSTGFSYTVPAAVTNLTIQGGTAVNCTGTAGTSSFSCSFTDNSVITDSYASNNPLMVFNLGGSSTTFRITGLTFAGGSTSLGKDNGIVEILSGSSQNVRYDHNHTKFSTYSPSNTEAVALRTYAPVAGVADHNYLDLGPDTGYSFGISIFGGYNDPYGNGDGTWANATPWGKINGVFYVETNYVTGGELNDCGNAGSMVIRYNTLSDTTGGLQTHGTKSPAGPARGCRSLEAYHNYITHPTGSSTGDSPIGSKIGPALIWGNNLAQGFYRFFTPATDRSGGDSAAETGTPNGWGNCGDAWDGNSNSAGYPCLDNIGRGQTVQHLNGADFPSRLNSSVGKIAWPQQYLEPNYLFANTVNPASGVEVQIRDNTTQFNRDVYFECGSLNSACSSGFTGAAGTGSGLLSARPTSCTAGPGGTYATSPTGSYGVGYFATDANGGKGELYVCTSTNTWTGIYQPYAYPHPLAGGSSSAPPPASPGAPINLTGVVH
jgi:hypothetical protein